MCAEACWQDRTAFCDHPPHSGSDWNHLPSGGSVQACCNMEMGNHLGYPYHTFLNSVHIIPYDLLLDESYHGEIIDILNKHYIFYKLHFLPLSNNILYMQFVHFFNNVQYIIKNNNIYLDSLWYKFCNSLPHYFKVHFYFNIRLHFSFQSFLFLPHLLKYRLEVHV